MSEEKQSPGQAACIAWNAHYAEEHGITARNEWAASDERGRAAWEAAARAVSAPIEAERDKAYGERADLVAYLTACYPSVIEDDLSEWPVVFVSTPSGQLSWHIARSDLGAFRHVPRATNVIWDGHTTPEKYQRLAELTRTVATGIYGPQPTADL